MTFRRFLAPWILVPLVACSWLDFPSSSGDGAAPDAARPKLLERLSDQIHPVTTGSELAQRYFDQGMVLVFGFNHEAAVDSFRAAQSLDPECAMCFWGEALALGPNINAPMGPEAGRAAWAASQKALALAGNASARERAYIEALAPRYAEDPPEDRSALDRAYADAMAALHQADPTDLDAATLYAESLMDLYPWNYWTDDAQPREHTEEVLAVLEGVLERQPNHLGANHYYIHAVEEFFPERAESAADRLGPLAPDAGHLVHMPSHIFYRLGRYEDALEINRKAAAADEAFFEICRPGAFYRAAYYPHNVHFLWAAAVAEGRRDLAVSTSRKLAAVTRDLIPQFDFMQEFVAIPTFTMVRFGMWDALLGEPQPDPAQRYLTAIWHYGRGFAYLRTGRAEEAEAERAALAAIAAEPESETLILAGATATARSLMTIAERDLAGEIAAAAGDVEAAVAALRDASARQDALVYMEPPPFYYSVRQALGAVLLDAGRAAEAETAYREELAKFPKNGWSLFGLEQSLTAQGKQGEAAEVAAQRAEAWARADTQLERSRL